jgi:hypothetical protein
MELKEAIARWKELNVDRVVLTFNCGGDSMGDMDWEVFGANDQRIEDEDLISYFDRVIFDKVEFYVNSDGHYIGESGTVTILNLKMTWKQNKISYIIKRHILTTPKAMKVRY